MIELKRCLGPLTVAAVLAVAVAGVDAALSLAAPSPRWLHPELRAPPWDVDRIGNRVAGLVRQRRRRLTDPSTRLGVILGQSTAQVGLDPASFDEKFGRPYRWVNLSGVGGGTDRIAELAGLLAYLDPKPQIVVFGVNPFMLATVPDSATARPVSPARALSALRAGRLPEVKSALQSWVWAFRYRSRISWTSRKAFSESRAAMLGLFGQGVEVVFPAASDPWAVEAPDYFSAQRDELQRLQMEQWQQVGWFDARNYSETGLPARMLVRMVATCRALRVPAHLILMPEKSVLRTKVPPEAERCLRSALADAFPDDAPPLTDLRDAIDDHLFFDNVHLNSEGKRVTSRVVADRVFREFHAGRAAAPPGE